MARTRIGSVYVTYQYLDGNEERTMNDADRQYVGKLLREGYVEGELLTFDGSRTHRGWWKRVGRRNRKW
jgi:hypothetical protein